MAPKLAFAELFRWGKFSNVWVFWWGCWNYYLFIILSETVRIISAISQTIIPLAIVAIIAVKVLQYCPQTIKSIGIASMKKSSFIPNPSNKIKIIYIVAMIDEI